LHRQIGWLFALEDAIDIDGARKWSPRAVPYSRPRSLLRVNANASAFFNQNPEWTQRNLLKGVLWAAARD
jgi:hypothetical protein